MGAKKDIKKDSGEKKSAEAGVAKKPDSGSSTIVFKLDLHCEGCANKVKSSIRRLKGVETVNADIESNKLTVTGKVDPKVVKERIEHKTKKKVEIVSPQPKKDGEKGDKKGGDDKPSEKKSDDKKADAEKPKVVLQVDNQDYGQNPYTYTIPSYNQNYYNQDYGVSTSNYGYMNEGHVNHGYAMQYSNGPPPPPPPMYLHDPSVPDAGMFSDEDPNASCSIM